MGAKAERVTGPTVVPLSGVDAAELRRDNAALEAEVERLEDQIAQQEFYLLDGYVVAFSPVGDGTYIATCPTLHASVQEDSVDATLASLREAVATAKSAHELAGRPLPPKDVLAGCLD